MTTHGLKKEPGKGKITKSSSLISIVYISLSVLLLIVGSVIVFTAPSKKNSERIKPPEEISTKVTPPQVDKPPVLQGRQSYNVISEKNPKITKITIDPLDAKIGQIQNISALIQNSSPVTSVSLKIATDNGEKELKMKLTEGSEFNGVWEASHTMNDVYEKVYHFKVTARDKNGESLVTITSR